MTYALYMVVPPIIEAGLGALISYAIVRFIPVQLERKRLLYCLIAISLFTPVMIPITGAGVFIFPALLVGFLALPTNPAWNVAFLVVNVLFAIWVSRRVFVQPQSGRVE